MRWQVDCQCSNATRKTVDRGIHYFGNSNWTCRAITVALLRACAAIVTSHN
jgi:hypothetical protein